MALTKPQKKFILNNYKVLTIKELSDKLRIKETDVGEYLRQNKKKPLVSVDELKNNSALRNEREKTIELSDEIKTKKENIGIIKILKENWKFLLCVSLGILVLYFNALGGDFVSDDYASISQNPNVGNINVMFAGGNTAVLTNYFINMLFGSTVPIAYHVVSVLLFITFVWVAFVAIMLVFNEVWLSRIMILLFAVLPVHVESVSWISGRIYLLISLWVMLGFISFLYFLRNNNWKYLLSMIVFFTLGFVTDKPRPFALFLIIGLYLIYKKVNLKQFKIFRHWPVLIGMIIIAGLIAWPNVMTRINSVNSGYNSSGSIFYNPFFQYPTAMAKYLQLLFIPMDLTLYHTMYTIPVWLNWFILLTYITAVIYFYFKDKRIFFALVFIFAGTAPSMAPVKVSWLVAERYVFLGSLGFCLFLALCFERIRKKNLYVSVILLAVLMSFYSIRTFMRNIDWQTNHNLWVNTVQVSPNSHNAWNNIGDDYDKLKQYDNAIKGFTQSTVVKPDYADAYHNRANIFYKTGQLELARDSYNTALRYSPTLFQTYFSLVQIDMMQKRYDLAFEHAQAVVKIQPNIAQSHYVFGVVLAQVGQLDGAVKELTYATQIDPTFKPASDLLKNIKSQLK